MPVIKTETIHFDNKPFKKVVRLDRRTGQFTIQLPEWMSQMLGITSQEVFADSLAKVEGAFRDACRRARETATVSRKIIAYHIGVNAVIERQGQTLHQSNDISFAHGVCLSIAAMVCMEYTYTHPESNVAQYKYVRLESSLPHHAGADLVEQNRWAKPTMQRMDWTENREQFFCAVILGLEDLIMQVVHVIGDPERLLSYIDRGRLLDIGGGAQADSGIQVESQHQ